MVKAKWGLLLAAVLIPLLISCAQPPEDTSENGISTKEPVKEQEIPEQIKETDSSIKATSAISGDSQPTGRDTNNPAGIPQQEESKESEQEKIAVSHWKRVFAKALEEINCPPPPKRNFSDKYYKGPMIDTHIHIQSLPDGAPGFPDEYYTGSNLGIKQSIAEWVCMMDYEGTNSSFAFFAVWDPIRDESLEIVKGILEAYPGRFIPFIMPPDRDGDPDGYPTVDAGELEGMLQVYPGLFKGYGEIGLYGHPGGAPALPPDSPRLMEIYPVVQKSDLLVYFHLGEGQKESFERALKANPDITFIFHGDQLIDCGSCDKTLDDVADILENHPNVFYGIDELYGDIHLLRQDVSKEEFIAHFKDYRPLLKQDLARWKDFIETHPNQVLWGTDRGVGPVWSIDPEVAIVLNNYTRYFIGHLNPAVQERFAYKNAENLLGEAS
ncbi:amidohydrolase family protein [Candidatus Woesearchaeota archaeon]|nr:amidohydrolase family protein [Candidatus Woesearchaeota archaeon]